MSGQATLDLLNKSRRVIETLCRPTQHVDTNGSLRQYWTMACCRPNGLQGPHEDHCIAMAIIEEIKTAVKWLEE